MNTFGDYALFNVSNRSELFYGICYAICSQSMSIALRMVQIKKDIERQGITKIELCDWAAHVLYTIPNPLLIDWEHYMKNLDAHRKSYVYVYQATKMISIIKLLLGSVWLYTEVSKDHCCFIEKV